MKDYRVSVKVRNNRILKAIEDIGGEPGGIWCAANGLRYIMVNDFINMATSPLNAEGHLRSGAIKLCDVLNKLPEDLWSSEQLYPLEKNFSEMEMDHAQVVALLPTENQSYLPDYSDFETRQTKALIDKALSRLKEREQEVIRFRFYDELTVEECAKRLGLSKVRVREIESKSLRKMRSPTMIGLFVDCVDMNDELRAEYKRASGLTISRSVD